MKKPFLFSVLFVAMAGWVMAAEFWLEPKRYRVEAGEELVIDFREGDSFSGDLWDMKKNAVERMQWFSFSSTRDLLKTINLTKGKNLAVRFPIAGTQLLVLESRPVLRKWGAKEFAGYCEEQEFASSGNQASDSVAEYVVRLAKVLVQAGSKTDDTYKKRTGQRLEILPLKNPYGLVTGDYLTCQILFEGKPLPHALVKVWSRLNRTTFLQNIYSEKDGTIAFPISTKGGWMVSVTKMIPSEKDGAEWMSLWSSVVFGI